MTKKIITSTIIAFVVSYALGPPDAISSFSLGVISAFFCFATLLILARFKFAKASPSSMHIVVCILVCIVSVMVIQTWLSYKSLAFHANPFPDCVVYSVSSSASYSAFSIGNLLIVHSSNRNNASSEKVEYVICSVDLPKSCSYDRSTWMFHFSDDKSTGFSSSADVTVWIDEQHEIERLGPILGEEEVSLLRDHRHDEELNISSSEQLLAIVNKLKAGKQED